MPEPTYEVYRPPTRSAPESPAERPAPPAYDEHRSPRRGGCAPRGVARGGFGGRIPAPFVPGAICSVIWLMSGGGYFWPMWVFLPALIMTFGGGRYRR